MLENLHYAIRTLGKSPGFTAVALLSLALGIGANTAIFTLINALLLRDLPVRQPERLVQLSAVRKDGTVPFSYLMFREVERNQRVFSGLIAWGFGGMHNVEVNGVLLQNHVVSVTGNCYSELGAVPLLGRLLAPDDSNPQSASTSQVAIASYEFWQRRLGGTCSSPWLCLQAISPHAVLAASIRSLPCELNRSLTRQICQDAIAIVHLSHSLLKSLPWNSDLPPTTRSAELVSAKSGTLFEPAGRPPAWSQVAATGRR
jgi:MacB-like periplasmic core domain